MPWSQEADAANGCGTVSDATTISYFASSFARATYVITSVAIRRLHHRSLCRIPLPLKRSVGRDSVGAGSARSRQSLYGDLTTIISPTIILEKPLFEVVVVVVVVVVVMNAQEAAAAEAAVLAVPLGRAAETAFHIYLSISLSLSLCIYIYIYTCVYICIYAYIYIYRERERDMLCTHVVNIVIILLSRRRILLEERDRHRDPGRVATRVLFTGSTGLLLE